MTETKAPVELTSILNQVQALQADREKLMAELESTKSQMGKLQVNMQAQPEVRPPYMLARACVIVY